MDQAVQGVPRHHAGNILEFSVAPGEQAKLVELAVAVEAIEKGVRFINHSW